MAGRGPAPQPTERKRLLGNPGKRRLPPSNVVALAPMVGPTALAIDDGDDLVGALLAGPASAWIAEPDRTGILQLLRDGWDRRRALLDDIAENGESYASNGQGGTRYYRRPEALALDELEKRIAAWLAALGLTPADRSRLGVAEVRARSKLEALRARRESRSHAG